MTTAQANGKTYIAVMILLSPCRFIEAASTDTDLHKYGTMHSTYGPDVTLSFTITGITLSRLSDRRSCPDVGTTYLQITGAQEPAIGDHTLALSCTRDQEGVETRDERATL